MNGDLTSLLIVNLKTLFYSGMVEYISYKSTFDPCTGPSD